ncbi:MAG: hypothetical protein ABI793_12240 [Flavobacterium sp.]
MAIWQVGFFILPKESVESIDSFRISNEHTFDDAPYWKNKCTSPVFFKEIDFFLPQTKSWAEYLTMYGNENSNRFEIISENGLVESVSFRIDFTSDYKKILDKIIKFCVLNEFVILDEKLNLVPLNFELANSLIKNSPQVKKYNDLLNN